MTAGRLALLSALFTLAPAPRGAAAAEPFTHTTVSVGRGQIDLTIEDEPGALAPAEIERWVRRAAVAVSSFYGRFPVARVRMVVRRVPGRGIHGTTFGGGLVRMRLGREASAAQLERDWTMTHEMFHLGFPDLDRRHLWMEEGMATYFEPIARARVGDVPPDELWRELFEGLPKGLPRPGEGGLDQTPSWGATYWGGALFWFLADVQIRERTGNRRSADDVLRAVLDAGGDGGRTWSIERVLAVGDRATGTSVMTELYRRLAARRFAVDLDQLARRLGVAGGAGRADRPDDRAPLAALRRSITARSAARCRAAPPGARPRPPAATWPTPCPAYRAPSARPGTRGR